MLGRSQGIEQEVAFEVDGSKHGYPSGIKLFRRINHSLYNPPNLEEQSIFPILLIGSKQSIPNGGIKTKVLGFIQMM